VPEPKEICLVPAGQLVYSDPLTKILAFFLFLFPLAGGSRCTSGKKDKISAAGRRAPRAEGTQGRGRQLQPLLGHRAPCQGNRKVKKVEVKKV